MIGWKTAGALLCAALLLFVLCRSLVVRRRKIKEQICQMELPQKTALLNELAEPFGFFYDEREGVFSSRRDAWQRRIGYTAAFDRGAFGACMVLDAFPVYFDYGGKTWLIEFWKGQYGINTGGEVGVYHAKEEIPPHAYPTAHFLAAEDEEMPKICCRLERNGGKLYEYCERHWWLTGFCMGMFSQPREIALFATVTFGERQMAQAMLRGLRESKIPREKYRLCGSEIFIQLDFGKCYPFPARFLRGLAQCFNRLHCFWYRLFTRPFCSAPDGLLFLYYQLPVCLLRMLRLSGRRYPKSCERRRNEHGM